MEQAAAVNSTSHDETTEKKSSRLHDIIKMLIDVADEEISNKYVLSTFQSERYWGMSKEE